MAYTYDPIDGYMVKTCFTIDVIPDPKGKPSTTDSRTALRDAFPSLKQRWMVGLTSCIERFEESLHKESAWPIVVNPAVVTAPPPPLPPPSQTTGIATLFALALLIFLFSLPSEMCQSQLSQVD